MILEEPTEWGWQLRTNVPEYRAELGSPVAKHKQLDKGKPLPLLQQGDTVRIRDHDWSRKARLLKEVAPRSHIVETEDGRLLRCNRQHKLRTLEDFRAMPDDGKSHDAEGDNAKVASQDTQVQGPSQHCLATRSRQAKEPGAPELQNEVRRLEHLEPQQKRSSQPSPAGQPVTAVNQRGCATTNLISTFL